MRYQSRTRVLALDLHPRRVGYVVLEGPDRLLDWGVCSYRRKGNSRDVLIQRRLRPLLERWRPTFVMIHGARQMPPRKHLLRERLLKGVVAEAKNYRARVQILKKWPTGRAERLTKYERAQAVVQCFPVLTRKLPPKRKPWESEHYSMSILEALAIAVQCPDRSSRPKQSTPPHISSCLHV
jgi:hypothetical protein